MHAYINHTRDIKCYIKKRKKKVRKTWHIKKHLFDEYVSNLCWRLLLFSFMLLPFYCFVWKWNEIKHRNEEMEKKKTNHKFGLIRHINHHSVFSLLFLPSFFYRCGKVTLVVYIVLLICWLLMWFFLRIFNRNFGFKFEFYWDFWILTVFCSQLSKFKNNRF